MTTTKIMPSRSEFFAAQNTMKARGWEHVLSAMDGDSKEGRTDFGLLYTKAGIEFWMNYKTIGNLPA